MSDGRDPARWGPEPPWHLLFFREKAKILAKRAVTPAPAPWAGDLLELCLKFKEFFKKVKNIDLDFFDLNLGPMCPVHRKNKNAEKS